MQQLRIWRYTTPMSKVLITTLHFKVWVVDYLPLSILNLKRYLWMRKFHLWNFKKNYPKLKRFIEVILRFFLFFFYFSIEVNFFFFFFFFFFFKRFIFFFFFSISFFMVLSF